MEDNNIDIIIKGQKAMWDSLLKPLEKTCDKCDGWGWIITNALPDGDKVECPKCDGKGTI